MSEGAFYKKAQATDMGSSGHQTHDSNGIRVGAWGAELCGCFTDCVPNCLMATCLPCVSLAQVSHRINVARFSVVLLTFLALTVALLACSTIATVSAVNEAADVFTDTGTFYWASNAPSASSNEPKTKASYAIYNIVSGVAALLYTVLTWQLRTKVRERFQIPGSCLEDFCCVWWCSCCTIAQMATHTKSYKPRSCDFGPPDMLPAFE